MTPVENIESAFIDDQAPLRRPGTSEGVAPGEGEQRGLATLQPASLAKPGGELAEETEEDEVEDDGGDDGAQNGRDHQGALVIRCR
uniref:Uncharacterized protein n=1 Tax=Nymphaea colorata TaxID=210225 RepID=A0A5K1G500_9MAGN